MDGNFARVTHHLVILVDVRSPKVNYYIHDEHDVDDQVDDLQRVIGEELQRVALLGRVLVLELKRRIDELNDVYELKKDAFKFLTQCICR